MTPPDFEDVSIAVVGLGYVGLPLAVYLARQFPVVGFDISKERVEELNSGLDRTKEVTDAELAEATKISFHSDQSRLADCNVYIITVPTPIDEARRPDLGALIGASKTVGACLKPGDVVVYESTVFPGATEDICVPHLEAESGLRFNEDFFAGYSPERINPGDMKHRLPDIQKVVAGSREDVGQLLDRIYGSVITAGTHLASSIKVAEAAKVIENIQRDVNIALVNELAMLFKRMNLDTAEILKAAGTKWNFHPYQPGLVGGHCIGVDPYYLTHKAQSIGFHPEMILAGRRINDGMADFIAQDILKSMLKHGTPIDGCRILVLGFTFKENCPDLRNTKIANLVSSLGDFAESVVIYDPHADQDEAKEEYGIQLSDTLPDGPFDVVVLAVRHKEIMELGIERIRQLTNEHGLVYDIKGVLPTGTSDACL